MQAIQAVSSIKFTSLLLLAAALTQGESKSRFFFFLNILDYTIFFLIKGRLDTLEGPHIVAPGLAMGIR